MTLLIQHFVLLMQWINKVTTEEAGQMHAESSLSILSSLLVGITSAASTSSP
jgi:hypothetical protein